MKISIDEALDILMKNVSCVSTEECFLEDAGGRVLAEDILAVNDVPGFDRSPYDGYAFNSRETSSRDTDFKVTGVLKAGEVWTERVSPGNCIKIMTGAKIPEGTDCVVKFEDIEENDGFVTIHGKYNAYDNVVRAGEDIKRGTLLLNKGEIVDSVSMGILASEGINRIKVFRKLRVGVITTGEEIIEFDQDVSDIPIENGKIYDSNRYIFMQRLKEYGFEPIYIGHAKDDMCAITELLTKGATQTDVVISTGGVSVGDYDLVKDAMRSVGVEILFDGVQLKPGMACCYGKYGDVVFCALSGNPASALTNFDILAVPALKKRSGERTPENSCIETYMSEAYSRVSGCRAVRGRIVEIEGNSVFVPADGQGNVMLLSSKGCNAYVLSKSPLAKGQIVKAIKV